MQLFVGDPARRDVVAGGDQRVELCRERCAYFPFCGGGPPANKFFENQTFVSTETLFCRLHKKVCLDITLALLERDAKDAGAVPPTESAPQLERAPA